jgi:hypothetical protein
VGAVNRDLIVSPPVQSLESARLLQKAYEAFELDKEANRASAHVSLLETRFQWSKTQFLAGVAIALFIAERLKLFEWAYKWLHLPKPPS